MFNKIKSYIETHIKLNKNEQESSLIIVGLSGGPDSIFLLHFFKKLKKKLNVTIHAAHLDHGWRKESANDAEFCKQLCQKLNIPITIAHAKNLDVNITYNGSQEEVGRKLRRHFFAKLKNKLNADYVALAHHLQDQQETFFIRLLRGTSLSGLTAIKPVQGFYIRPLLATSKADILTYLNENNITYLTDPTNISDAHLRNRIRKNVIPALAKCDARFDQKFQDTFEQLCNANAFLQNIAQKSFIQIFNNDLHGNKEKFLMLENLLQKRILILWLNKIGVPYTPSTGLLNELIRFIKSPQGGIHMIDKAWGIEKRLNRISIISTSRYAS